MVAGTDAFAGALYLLFDVVFLVVEPTPESVGVYLQFRKLAEEANTFGQVFVVGNKVLDEDDEQYLRESVGDKLVATIGHDATLRKQRQRGQTITTVPEGLESSMIQIERFARKHQPDANGQLRRLHELHRYFAGKDFTIAKYGDLRDQVDEQFEFASPQ
jgi:CO dehydrogenase maturation factor